MSEDQGSAGGVNYYGAHGNRIVGLGPWGDARTVLDRPVDDGGAWSGAEHLGWPDEADAWKRFAVGDVLRHSVRADSAEQYEAFNDTVLYLLCERAPLPGHLADILYIAAGVTIGAVDPLEAHRGTRPWNIRVHPEPEGPSADRGAQPWSGLDRFVTVLLPEGQSLVVQGHRGAGYTQYFPAAVYLAGVPAEDLRRDPVPMTANLLHEYTHVALGRIYANASLPWPDDRSYEPGRTDALRRAFADAVAAGRIALASELTAVSHAGLRQVLKHLAESLRDMRPEDWDREAVPYLIEAEVAAFYHGEPEAVSAVFGPGLPAAFERYVAPELEAAAGAVEAAALIRR
ncbi:hypothetical protein ACFVBM_31485 [Streptomyces griseus]|uniref:hypothetical protein n=1 Tax=Streptomyces griseus TaxID=1911 RepID=UPI00365AF78B